MVELAKAYIQVIPSMKNSRKLIEKEFGGKGLGESQGKLFSNGFLGSAKNLGSKVVDIAGKTIKTGLVAGAAATGGLMATAINKGFGRLSAIEQATTSLEGMGLSAAQVAEVMENANAAVTGTAFGLDAAATAAKGLVTAGVKPGEDLERVLRLVGDSAAQAGTSMDEMGIIWQKVASKGKLQGDEALQLMERGIPIYQMVADKLKITTEEAQKLGSEGKISFEMFADVMEDRFAGSALAMGDTVAGSFANVGAALGRLGEKILAGPFADAPKVFQAFTDQLNAMGPTVETVSTTTYNALKGVWEILSGKGYSNALADAFGEINAAKVSSTLITLRSDLNTTRATAESSLFAIRREFLWLDEAATLDNLLGAVERGSSLLVTFADGGLRVATALAPMVSYAGQAATILGGGMLDAIESLAPDAIDLAVALAEAGSSFSRVLVPGASAAIAVLEPAVSIFGDLLGWVADLPEPVLIAGAAFLSLKGSFGPLPKLAEAAGTGFGKLKSGFDKAKDGAETFVIHAMYASDATRGVEGAAVNARGVVGAAFGAIGGAAKGLANTLKAAFLANPIGITIAAATTALSLFTSQSEKSKRKIDDLADSFGEFGEITRQTKDQIYDNLLADENWFGLGDNLADRFRDAGIEISDVIDAIAGDADKLRAVTTAIEEMAVAAEQAGDKRRAAELRDLNDALQKQANDFEAAEGKAKEYRDAMGETADSVRAHTDEIQRQIDAQRAANDLFAGAANKMLAVRDAERSYADTLERSQEVIRDIESSERDRQAALDDIAAQTHRVAQAQNDANASQSTLNATMRQGREDFINMALEMENTATGAAYTREEAEALADSLGLIEGNYTANVDVDSELALGTLDELTVAIDETTGTIMINGNPQAAETKLATLVDTIDAETGEVIIDGNRFPADATVEDLVAHIASQHGTVEIEGDNFQAIDVLNATLTAISKGEENVTLGAHTMPAQDALAMVRNDIKGTHEAATIDGNPRPAYKQTDAVGQRIRDTSEQVKIGGNPSQAYSKRDEVLLALRLARGNVRIGGNRSLLDTMIGAINGAVVGTAYVRLQSIGGGNLAHNVMADGGVLEFYGSGGLRENHVAQIAPAGAWRVWAEPETGGEAYIPLAQSKRSRSEQILAEVADRFGYQLMKAKNYADGGIASNNRYPGGHGFPQVLNLRVDGHEFRAYIEGVTDSRPGVAAANEFVDAASRFRKGL